LYEDFLRFLDALVDRPADPWAAYQEHYLRPNEEALRAWWEQVMGLPEAVWAERVRAIKPEHYGLLRDVLGGADLSAMAAEVIGKCEAVLPMIPEPEVYYLVGFFSPDAFTFQVGGRWAVGVGLERFGSLHLLPVLLAHEYGHCYRRGVREAKSLGERMVDEGFAVELAARVLPERSRHEHLLMRPGQVAVLEEYEGRLWDAVEGSLGCQEGREVARILYGRTGKGAWASRAGVYLGWRLVRGFLEQRPGAFDAAAEEVLAYRLPPGRIGRGPLAAARHGQAAPPGEVRRRR
jgi:hypothetical protein